MAEEMACCFPGRTCANLEESECLSRGGLPYQPFLPDTATRCLGSPPAPGATGFTELIECNNQACCKGGTFQNPEDAFCVDATYAQCVGSGGTSYGRGSRCAGVNLNPPYGPDGQYPSGCAVQFTGGVITGCCGPDGTRIDVYSSWCGDMGWSPPNPDGTCPEPPTDDQCRAAGDDRPGTETWTMELCSPAALGVAIVGPNVPNHRKGYGALLTLRKARNLSEQCEHSVSEFFLDENRYGQPVFCSRQDRFAPAGLRAHHGTMVLQPDSPTPATRVGYGVMASSYDAPDWSEAILGSRLVRCTEELQ